MPRVIAEKPKGIREVARTAGVSVSTVSYAFSGKGTISDDLRQKVLRTARTLGYQPSALARGLRGARTHTVGIIWELGGPHPSVEMTRSIAIRAQSHGCVSYIVDGLARPAVVQRALADFAGRRVDAVVVEVGPSIETMTGLEGRLKEFSAAVVVTGRPVPIDVDQVVRDRGQAVQAVVDHFAACGRRNPVLIGRIGSSPRKADTFTRRLAEHGLTAHCPPLIDVGRNGSQASLARACWEALNERFGAGEIPFDAVMCTTDEMAVATMAWLKSQGLKIPDDVAVVGSNNHDSSPFEAPPLASIERHNTEVADAIDEMIFTRLDDGDSPVRTEYIPMTFVARQSAG